MASWKKYFDLEKRKPSGETTGQEITIPVNKFSSFLPEIYAGQPQRIERYNTYELMDLDPVINSSLDVIAESCTQKDEKTNSVFRIMMSDDVGESTAEVLKESLKTWTKINKLDSRMFKIFRNVLKMGDQFFIRDPETFQLYWIDPSKVQSIIVNQAKGKIPETYVISDLDLNLKTLVATKPPPANLPTTGVVAASPGPVTYTFPRGSIQSRSSLNKDLTYVSSSFVLHLSLSDGLDNNWPFGISILENIFKVYKQKELLEDAIIIYRVQRAPERRVFYIDVGTMPPHKAMAFINRVKNEIHQRRIPNRTGGSSSILDSSYNPLSMLEDYFFAVTAEGRGSRVETLPGGENLGQIDDLLYFDNKMKRGLRVPSSYIPGGTDENVAYTDGRVGTAFIQEFRFVQYCKRLQQMIEPVFDAEFKNFLKHKNINVDLNSFEIKFNEPQNFSRFRQIEIDSAQINVFQPLAEIPYLSKRFILKRFLNLTHEEILENEKLWAEENNLEIDSEEELNQKAIGSKDISGNVVDDEKIKEINSTQNSEGEADRREEEGISLPQEDSPFQREDESQQEE